MTIKRNYKLLSIVAMLIAFMSFCFLSFKPKAELTTSKPTWDTKIYDTSWTKANVKYWVNHFKINLFCDRTESYIRITDSSGNFINDITRMEASYVIGDKQYWANNTFDKGFFHWNAVNNKEGIFQECHKSTNKANANKKFLDNTGKKTEYEECNYLWWWNYNVKEIVYLYIWYVDPTTGDEVAASFGEKGEHPKYDEAGKLIGIYDDKDQLLEGYSLSNKGIPIDAEGKETITVNDQKVGESEEKGIVFNFSSILPNFSGASNTVNTIINVVKIVILSILAIIALLIVIAIMKLIIKIFKK